MESYVAVRLPSTGTILGEALRRHVGSCITGIPVAPPSGERAQYVALVEGLPDSEVAHILLAWNLRYGMPAEVMGSPYALRLPVAVSALPPPLAELVEADRSLPVAGQVSKDDWTEQWIRCSDAQAAQNVAAELALRFARWPGAAVYTGHPRRHDVECWEALRLAVDVEADAAA